MKDRDYSWGSGFDFAMRSAMPSRRFRSWYGEKSHFAPRRADVETMFSRPGEREAG